MVSTRESILRAALRVIGEQGVSGLTNRRIATDAGVSLGTLTYHFPSQTELLRQAMLLFAENETIKLRGLVNANKTGDITVEEAAAAVERVLEQMTFGADEIAPLELYLQAGRDPDLRDATQRCFAAYDELALTVLRALKVDEPQHIAPAVVALIAGLQLRRLATGASTGSPAAGALTMLIRGANHPKEVTS
ncbi:HTH-type transcriptional regulator BetI [Amycolatopsis sp. CA-230715]|nr:TetR family transcriptional regulator [Amycolatopsis sp. CA-230715]QWF79960.1 HTH-type transcriptional regulator BetI [Amycolatopsis sp. CA-230715]